MEISILVVVYNQSIKESATLCTLQQVSETYHNTRLVVWNNGPEPIDKSELDPLKALGLNCVLIETLENRPLSHIYNDFIKNYQANKYLILDHDSSLNSSYWHAVKTRNNLLLLPKVISHGKICSPSKLPKDGKTYNKRKKFSAITSGMVLSQDLVSYIQDKYGDTFDSHYAFYGIDTTFMLRMKKLALCDKITVIDGFEHSLSKNEQESEQTKLFRAREMAISTALTTRHYTSYSSIRRFFKSVVRSVKKHNNYPLSAMFAALISGKHPKCK